MVIETERSKDAKRVAIWIRVSTQDQAQGESPEVHKKRARNYAEAKGWTVKEVYDLSGVSGKTVMEHPEAKRMLEHVKEGHITGLIFSKIARLARNTKELLELSDIFREQGADLISLGEAIDTSTPAGRLFFTMLAGMATWEREEIAERVAVSVPIRAKLGKNLGGQAVFGYQWKDGELIPNPTEAPVRKLIHELFLEHKRLQTVARLLNEQGYRTRKGVQFTHTTIERLLDDPTAKGLRRANYTRTGPRGTSWELKPKSEWVYVDCEPIVSAELWDECYAVLNEARKSRKPRSRKTVHVFSGLTFCACDTNTKMYVPSNSPKYVCSKCRNKVPIDDLDAIFHEQLRTLFFSPSEIAAYLREGEEAMAEKERLLAVQSGERSKIKREIDRLYDLYDSEAISKSGFGEKYHPLNERLEQIEDELPALQAQLDVLKIHYLSSDEIISEARDLYARWDTLSRDEKRAIVEAITESIVVGKEEIVINLHYLPSTSEGSEPPKGGGGGGGGQSQPPGKNKKSAKPHTPEKQKLSHPYIKSNDDKSCTNPQGRVHFLPFCKITLKAAKFTPFPQELRSVGDHLKKRRYKLELFQKDVALQLQVDSYTVCNWENNKTIPAVRYLPRIIQFLGYYPYPAPETLGERLLAYRRHLGLSCKRMAQRLSVDEGTLARWERGIGAPSGKHQRSVIEFLDTGT